MFPTSAFGQVPLGYGYPGQQQQQPGSIYQSQYGNLTGFNPQMPPGFPSAPQPRGQSAPNAGRQYPPTTGPYVPQPPTSSRRGQQGQYPPPASSQHYEYRSAHTSKSKKHRKRRSVSPNAAEDQTLYSDHEQQQQQQQQQQQSEQAHEHKARSRSPSPTLASRSKNGAAAVGEQSHATESTAAPADGAQGGVARSEEEQATVGSERRKSSSKRRHHHRDRYTYYNGQSAQGAGLENLFQPPYQQQKPYYGEYQTELPPQLKVHQQPLYSTYNQAYADSTRQNETSGKHSRRSSRLPPEAKQKLLPHEDDQQTQTAPQQQQQAPGLPPTTQVLPGPQQSYPYGPLPGYPQQQLPPPPGPQPLQPYGVRPPFNPYQPYGPPSTQPNYYGSTAPGPYNALQPWTNVAPVNGPAEQEIQRLRSHIHSLESELHKLQKKLNKATLNNTDAADNVNQEEPSTRSHRRSKRDGAGSPRQTPVIVELNNTTSERTHRTSSKKHRRRTGSATSSQQGQSLAQQDSTATQHASEHITNTEAALVGGAISVQNTQAGNVVNTSRAAEVDVKSVPTKDPREQAAAQLAHAAAAHINNRQASVGVAPPPPQIQPQPQPPQVQPQQPQLQQQQQQQHQQQQQQVPGPLPPPAPQVVRPQIPNQQQQQQQQQQQYLYQQGVLPPQGPQIRGPAPRLPGPAPVRYPADPYQQQQQQQQQFINPQQRPVANPNFNQSNNNELFETDEIEEYEDEHERRSAEKILDAFERFYVSSGRPTTVPMKVKYIPDEINSISKRSHHHQRNTNNNNRYRSSSRQTRSSSSSSESESIYSHSPLSSRRSLYDNSQEKPTIGLFV